MFVEIGKARRQIALANPLLDFNQLLFIRRAGTGAGHMCDQYYGKDNQSTVHRSIEQLVTAPEADFPPSSADVDAGAHPRDQ